MRAVNEKLIIKELGPNNVTDLPSYIMHSNQMCILGSEHNFGCTTSWHIYDSGGYLARYIRTYHNREVMVHILSSSICMSAYEWQCRIPGCR